MSTRSIANWMRSRGWKPFAFQRAVWKAQLAGEQGLLHAPTGAGKTYAVWLGIIAREMSQAQCETRNGRSVSHPPADCQPPKTSAPPLTALWITPLRALANDIAMSLAAPLGDLQLPWTVETRTGDTSSAERRRQQQRLPTVLVTTPESLTLLLSYPDAHRRLATLRTVVIDEWHELLGSKRGVQTELALARLRRWLPHLQTWGLSATLGNLPQALEVLLAGQPGRIVAGAKPKRIRIQTILPDDIQRFPWSGHLGLRLADRVADVIQRARTTLVFTNTRSQAELWCQALLKARPQWSGQVALHHGSIAGHTRQEVEQRLRAGTMRAVVCTSSLDLGVDFAPVDQVIQVGSPKGIARLLQRAGRSGHQPGATSRLVCVPTHAFELVEYAAARQSAAALELEARHPLLLPLDVLAQHLVTVACGGGFAASALLAEVRATYAFRDLTLAQWQWTLDFVARGGRALRAYPQYCKLTETDGVFRPASVQIERLHRQSIGTITSDTGMQVRFVTGGSLGTIEESFMARLHPGDRFVFAGRVLELARVREMTAYVRRAKGAPRLVPRWNGSRFPLSVEMGQAVRRKLADARCGTFRDREMRAVRPVLALQQAWSHLPDADELLVERCTVGRGHHVFVYPFEGRLVHEGLGALLAYRIARRQPCSLTITANDYGFEMLSATPFTLDEPVWRELLSVERLWHDLHECLNAAELARRQFREIARVAGLVFTGHPGAQRTTRQLQASSGLLFDVFSQYDAENLLLAQARHEVFQRQLEASRLTAALRRLAHAPLVLVDPPQLTPLAFPLWAARIQATHLTSERWIDRVQRMAVRLEAAATPAPALRT